LRTGHGATQGRWPCGCGKSLGSDGSQESLVSLRVLTSNFENLCRGGATVCPKEVPKFLDLLPFVNQLRAPPNVHGRLGESLLWKGDECGMDSRRAEVGSLRAYRDPKGVFR